MMIEKEDTTDEESVDNIGKITRENIDLLLEEIEELPEDDTPIYEIDSKPPDSSFLPSQFLPSRFEEELDVKENNLATKSLTALLVVGMFTIFGGLFYTAIATFNNPPVAIADTKASSADPMVDAIELPDESNPVKPKDDVDYTDDMSDDHDGLFGDKPDFDPSQEPEEDKSK